MKQVYQSQYASQSYSQTHFIPKDVQNKVVGFIFELIGTKNGNKKEPIRILDAGIGDGTTFAIPLLEKASKNGQKMIVVGFDNSKHMLDKLKENLKAKKYSLNENKKENYFTASKNNQILIEVHNSDLDEGLPNNNSFADESFDLCLAVLVLHHLKNWRLGLLNLLKKVKNDGIFAIFEWTGAIKLREGNFDDYGSQEQNLIKFWEHYYKQRAQHNFWNPEIRATDYSSLIKILADSCMFREIKSYQPGTLYEQCPKFKYEDFIKWIKEGAYSNYYRGLTQEQRKKLAEEMCSFLKSLQLKAGQKVGEKLGFRIKFFKRSCGLPNANKTLENVIFDSLNKNKIFEDLLFEPIKRGDLNDFASLVLQHDCFAESTIFCVINQWDITTEHWKEKTHEERPLLLFGYNKENEEQFMDNLYSYIAYSAFLKKVGFSGTDFIFRVMKEKPIIIVKRCNDREESIKIEKTKIGRHKKVTIPVYNDLLSEEKIKKIIEKVKKESSSSIEFDNLPGEPLREDVWNFDISLTNEKVHKLINNLSNQLNFSPNRKYPSFLEKMKKGLKQFKIEDKEINKFARLLVLHLIFNKGNWDWIVYVPSESIIQNDKSETMGFGGPIICEKIEDEFSEKCLFKRVEILNKIVDLKYRSLGIENYAEKVRHEIKKHATRSAVAAIMARNMSHIHGSHIEPGLQEKVHTLREILVERML